MSKWKFDNHNLARNPFHVEYLPNNDIRIESTVDGKLIMQSAPLGRYSEEIVATWSAVNVNVRNFLYNAFLKDDIIKLVTHLGTEYNVTIDDYSETILQGSNSNGSMMFKIDITFRTFHGDEI